jgi:chemotaxis protein MotB
MSLLSDNLFFDLGSAELRTRNLEVLDKIAKVLRQDDHEIRVEGHTCDIPLLPVSRFKSNWELSTLRAAHMAEYLIKKGGIGPARISLVGYGEFRPIIPNDCEAHRMMNRRVDIILLRRSAYTIRQSQKYKLSPFIFEQSKEKK